MEFSYDEIYGVDLNEYCKKQNISIDKLISMIETDIDLLRKSLYKQVWCSNKENVYLIKKIKDTIDKKEKHLKRLKQWKKENVL